MNLKSAITASDPWDPTHTTTTTTQGLGRERAQKQNIPRVAAQQIKMDHQSHTIVVTLVCKGTNLWTNISN